MTKSISVKSRAMEEAAESSFGFARLKKEGSPVHPEDMDWEHPPGSGCKKCEERYKKQLAAYKEYIKNE